MPVRGLHHVSLHGSPTQIRAMRDFYCNVLGLREGPRPPFLSTGSWLYAGKSPLVHLVEVAGAPPGSGLEGPAVDHVAFACEGLDELRQRLEAKGVTHSISHIPMTGEVQIDLRDPSGMKVELTFTPHDPTPRYEGESGDSGLLDGGTR
jgi:catechol 2,3-dioxygenase-like lactoylglutathione lyase family enzyme